MTTFAEAIEESLDEYWDDQANSKAVIPWEPAQIGQETQTMIIGALLAMKGKVSDGMIAKSFGVTPPTVRRIRQELLDQGKIQNTTERLRLDGSIQHDERVSLRYEFEDIGEGGLNQMQLEGSTLVDLPDNDYPDGERPEERYLERIDRVSSRDTAISGLNKIARAVGRIDYRAFPWKWIDTIEKFQDVVRLIERSDIAETTKHNYLNFLKKVVKCNNDLKKGNIDEWHYNRMMEFKMKTRPYIPGFRGHPVPLADWKKMVDVLDLRTVCDFQKLVVLSLLFPLGMRIADALSVTRARIHFDEQYIEPYRSKTKRSSMVAIDCFPGIQEVLRIWMANVPDDNYLFFMSQSNYAGLLFDEPIDCENDLEFTQRKRNMGGQLKRISEMAGVEDWSTHCGRKSYSQFAEDAGLDLQLIDDQGDWGPIGVRRAHYMMRKFKNLLGKFKQVPEFVDFDGYLLMKLKALNLESGQLDFEFSKGLVDVPVRLCKCGCGRVIESKHANAKYAYDIMPDGTKSTQAHRKRAERRNQAL